MGNYYGREQKNSKQQQQHEKESDEGDFYSVTKKTKTKEIIVEGADYQQHPKGTNLVLSRTFQVRVTVDR